MTGPAARVHMDLDPEGELVQLARLVATGVASSIGMGIDEAEDCRAAVDEMCSTLIERAAPGAVLSLDLVAERVDGIGPSISVTGRVAVAAPIQLDEVRREISEMILDAVTDTHELTVDASTGEATFGFVRSTRRPRNEST
jgi:hypothetical protein